MNSDNPKRESNPVVLRTMSARMEDLKQTIFLVDNQRDSDRLWGAYRETADAYQEVKRMLIGLYNFDDFIKASPAVNQKLLANLQWVYARLAAGETVAPGDPWFALAYNAIDEAQKDSKNE